MSKVRFPVGKVYRVYRHRTGWVEERLQAVPQLWGLLRVEELLPAQRRNVLIWRIGEEHPVPTMYPLHALDGLISREVDEFEWLLARLAGSWLPSDDPVDPTLGCAENASSRAAAGV